MDVEDWEQCRVCVWDLVNIYNLLIQRDYGVSDAGVDEAAGDSNWRFYSLV